jgi:hypothetical protein
MKLLIDNENVKIQSAKFGICQTCKSKYIELMIDNSYHHAIAIELKRNSIYIGNAERLAGECCGDEIIFSPFVSQT